MRKMELQGLVMIGRFKGVYPVHRRDTGERVERLFEVKVGWTGPTGVEAEAGAQFWSADRYGEQSEVAAKLENDPPAGGQLLACVVRPGRFGDLTLVRLVELSGLPNVENGNGRPHIAPAAAPARSAS